MMRFVLGMVIGAAGAYWLARSQGEIRVDQRFTDMQDKANAVLTESRRILQETRQELASALEAGRNTVQSKAEQLRRPSGDVSDAAPPQPE